MKDPSILQPTKLAQALADAEVIRSEDLNRITDIRIIAHPGDVTIIRVDYIADERLLNLFQAGVERLKPEPENGYPDGEDETFGETV